ncbi:MAG: universal stress protein [Mycobacteriaceae bacterium]
MTVNPRIVVGVDGSPSSTCAVRWAAETAARHNAPLLLLSAWAIPGGYGSIGMPPSLLEDQETHCRRQLAEATRVAHETAPDAGLSVTCELATSPAVGTLLERSRDARIVVVGSRRLGELTAGLLGSVTSALAHHAHSPIAVIREWPRPADPTAQGPVVVGVDGSTNSEPAIAMAFEEASLRGVDLIAVHAWSDVNTSVPPPHDQGLPWASLETAEQATLAESLAGFTERYPDVTVRQVVVQDRPLRHLLSYTDTAQLLVVGSHGRGGFTSMLLGSTSTALLHVAECPLLIVRNRH